MNTNTNDDGPVPISAEEVAEYRELKAMRSELEKTAPPNGDEDEGRAWIELEVGGEVQSYELRSAHSDVLAHLQILMIFAEQNNDRERGLFQAALTSEAYDRFMADLSLVLRDAARLHDEDPEANPSVKAVYQSFAMQLLDHVKGLVVDPKAPGSPGGPSNTGRSSSGGSLPSESDPSEISTP